VLYNIAKKGPRGEMVDTKDLKSLK